MSLSQLEQESKFKKHLSEYWNSKGITQIKIPQIGGQQLNLFKLYKAVCKKGGGQAVSHNKLWKEIVDEFGLPSTCTSASFTLKNHYQKYLLGYQQRFFFGKDDNADLPELVAGRQRKPMKQGESMTISNRFGGYRPQGQVVQSTLSSELKKFYQKSDYNQHINFIKRTKMYPVMSQVKHMILAFQSPHVNEITYGINMLLLFSMNTQASFLFSQYPHVLESVTNFIEHHYPARNIVQLQYLRTLTMAIRNLLINHKNLQPFLQSPLVQVLGKIFQSHRQQDQQLIRNISDIFSSLSKIGWQCKQLFEMIQVFLQKDGNEDLQSGIDLLRSLVEQRQEDCQKIVIKKIQFFIRCLLHSAIEVRQSILEIFAYLTEKSENMRLQCVRNIKFMERLFALMSCSLGMFEKQAQLSCLIMNNIAQLYQSSVQNQDLFLKQVKPFEHKLALISFNDQFLSPITSSILFYVSGRVSSVVGKDQDKQKLLDKMRKNIERDRVSSEQEIDDDQDQQDEDEQNLEEEEEQDEQMEQEGQGMEENYMNGARPRKIRHRDSRNDQQEQEEQQEQEDDEDEPRRREVAKNKYSIQHNSRGDGSDINEDDE